MPCALSSPDYPIIVPRASSKPAPMALTGGADAGSLHAMRALLILLPLAACAPPAVLREPVGGASYTPVETRFAPMPRVMQRTGDPPIALPEPSVTQPAMPRWDQGARP